MGSKITRIEFTPGKNEQLETTVIMTKENRSVIHGVVLDENKCPVKDAVVKLFEMPNKDKCCELIPITHTFTDECGQFLFGPLPCGKTFVIKIWHDGITIRRIPGTHVECKKPCPNDCDKPCHHDHDYDC